MKRLTTMVVLVAALTLLAAAGGCQEHRTRRDVGGRASATR